jgi:glycosyltransferase involved in cell wall biosynthesis
MRTPEISVVMSVYNGAKYIRQSIESILSQEGVNFEFIIINDGSTDSSGDILSEYARKDNRIRIIEQENTGLTRALIQGCAETRGEFICRQDCGDTSKPGRLAKQLEHIRSGGNRALVSCTTNVIGPGHEQLYTSFGKVDDETVRNSLLSGSLNAIRGLSHHGSAFYPTELYKKAGGYRAEFYFAQDLDLWVRLARYGNVSFCPESLYEARFTADSISGVCSKEQIALSKIIIELRNLDPSDSKYKQLLHQASMIKPKEKQMTSKVAKARSLYFIGRCLKTQGNIAAKEYFWRSILNNPLHLKAWLSLVKVI